MGGDVSVQFLLTFWNIEDLLLKRGTKVSHEMVRVRWQRLGPVLAAEIRRLRARAARSV